MDIITWILLCKNIPHIKSLWRPKLNRWAINNPCTLCAQSCDYNCSCIHSWKISHHLLTKDPGHHSKLEYVTECKCVLFLHYKSMVDTFCDVTQMRVQTLPYPLLHLSIVWAWLYLETLLSDDMFFTFLRRRYEAGGAGWGRCKTAMGGHGPRETDKSWLWGIRRSASLKAI